MNKTVKAMKILSVVLMLMLMFTIVMGTVSNADSASIVDELTSGGGSADTTGIQGVGTNIVSIITTIGIIVAVVVLLILGIKYMMGSASEKAEYKKTMIPYLVGAVLIFGASAIAKAVIAMSETITTTAG